MAKSQEEKDKEKAEADAAAPAAAKPKAPTLKAGTKVNLVHANGSHLPAKVTGVHRDNVVDLETTSGIVITRSPFDPTGKQSDSWHFHTGPNSEEGAAE